MEPIGQSRAIRGKAETELSPTEMALQGESGECLFSTRLPNCSFLCLEQCLSSLAEFCKSLIQACVPRPYCPTALAQAGIQKKVWQRTRKVIREAKGAFGLGTGLKQSIAHWELGLIWGIGIGLD